MLSNSFSSQQNYKTNDLNSTKTTLNGSPFKNEGWQIRAKKINKTSNNSIQIKTNIQVNNGDFLSDSDIQNFEDIVQQLDKQSNKKTNNLNNMSFVNKQLTKEFTLYESQIIKQKRDNLQGLRKQKTVSNLLHQRKSQKSLINDSIVFEFQEDICQDQEQMNKQSSPYFDQKQIRVF